MKTPQLKLFMQKPESRIVGIQLRKSGKKASYLMLHYGSHLFLSPVLLCTGLHDRDVSSSLIYLN
ncbi:MAG: hypothetical protein Fur0041_18360 [Bacteroidia bacterium]